MKCPGQDMIYWKENAIFDVDCPKCGAAVEFYKDDTNRKCGECGNRFVNPKMDFGCASYCQFAEQCLGTLPVGGTAKVHFGINKPITAKWTLAVPPTASLPNNILAHWQ